MVWRRLNRHNVLHHCRKYGKVTAYDLNEDVVFTIFDEDTTHENASVACGCVQQGCRGHVDPHGYRGWVWG